MANFIPLSISGDDASTPIMKHSGDGRQPTTNSPFNSGDHDHRHHKPRGFFSIGSGGSSKDKEGYYRRNSIRAGSRASTPESDYGAIEDWEDLDEDIAVNLEDDMTIPDDGSVVPMGRFSMLSGFNNKREPSPRRWSVMEKLNRRYYCRIRSCDELAKIINGKCIFSTLMLFVFIFLLYLVIRAIFFNKTFEPQTYDFIIIGAGPAGSVLTRKLIDGGARVLLLEAGNVTQFDLGGIGYSNSPLTVFDIPLLWTAALKFPGHTWSFEDSIEQYSMNNAKHRVSDAGRDNDDIQDSSSLSEINLKNGIKPIIPKGLGGGGAMNAMVYTTALESDIKKWNIPRISWDIMNETYRDLETFNDMHATYNGIVKSNMHGHSGPIGTTAPMYGDELSRQFIESAINVGIPYADDFNNPATSREGAGYYQFRIKNGVRSSAAQTMLGPLIKNKQPGFTMEVEAEVKRILLVNMDNSGGVASSISPRKGSKSNHSGKGGDKTSSDYFYYSYGVEYEVHGVRKTALLGQSTSTFNKLKKFEGSRSIVLSAGAIMTPKLLMDSGIGDAAVLQAAKILPLVNNKNVGKNLQDHPAVQLVLQPNSQLQASYPTSYTLAEQWMNYFSAVETLKYMEQLEVPLAEVERAHVLEQIGVLGSPGFGVGAFLISPFANKPVPDIQVTVYPTMELAHIVYNNRYSVKEELAKSFGSQSIGPVVVLTIALLDANMRYNVSICSSSNGAQYPCIYEEVPLNEIDTNRLAWGVKKMRDVLNEAPLANSIDRELIPGSTVVDNALINWITLSVSPSSHWTSSCRMGSDPSESALDTQFNVRGVKGLKVVDASAIPFVPSGNIGATVTAFASVAANIISGN